MTEATVSEFEALNGKLQGVYEEAVNLSKKSAADPFNKFKLNITNAILSSANKYLASLSRPVAVDGFSQFEDTDLPSNSDVAFVLSQYLAAFESLRIDNITHSAGNWYWVINGASTGVRTAPPRKLRI